MVATQQMNTNLRELYPFTSNYYSLISGHRYHYVDEGKGETLIFLHGNPTWSFYYRDLIKELRKNYRTLAPDHLGCGLSDKPQDYSYTLENHIENLESWVDSLGLKKVTLIVHDWGGAIGFGLATRRPDLIQGVVIFNTAAFRSQEIPWQINLCRSSGFGEFIVRALNAFAWPATFMTTVKSLPPEVKAGYLWPYQNYQERIAIARFVQDIPLQADHPSYQTLEQIEKKLGELKKVKKLILWGGKDFCFHKKFYDRWLEIYPEAERVYFPKAGHYVVEDAQEEIIGHLRPFLADLYD